ncbi:MAG: CRISPR-associated ring nuclease Csm6 [Methylococcales bacterium]|nr:CRISPR-associated ring nuclease Csm6 [Methylococcales bacterium]
MKHPHQFTTRILLAVSGLSPQILTETLYGLTVTTNTPFIPTEIHLITTIEGAHRAKLDLLHQDTGKFLAFCEEYQMPDIQFNESNIHIITDHAGQYLDDIRNPEADGQ